MKEKWKWIKGFKGLYKVSNKGRIKSYHKKENGYIMKTSIEKHGYKTISLCKNNQHNTKLVHRLVAEAFIPNPKNKKEVNHKDFDKTNNCIDNLEWLTPAENINHYNKNHPIKRKEAIEKTKKKCSKPVLQINIEKGNIINEFYSIQEAARQNNIHFSAISRVANKYKPKNRGVCKTAGGYKWEFKEEYYNED